MTARQLHRAKTLWRHQDDSVSAAADVTWMVGAPCQTNPDLFFSDDPDEITEAKLICNTRCATFRFNACRDAADCIEWGVCAGKAREERVEKVCFQCYASKLLREFRKDSTNPDGYDSTCKACLSVKSRTSRPLVYAEALAAANADRATRAEVKAHRFAKLTAEHGRDEAIRILKITPRTANRYDQRLRARQEVAA